MVCAPVRRDNPRALATFAIKLCLFQPLQTVPGGKGDALTGDFLGGSAGTKSQDGSLNPLVC